MKSFFIRESQLASFVDELIANHSVMGPVAKGSRFTFEELKDSEDLRLDYDTTILPPKKAFFPPRQDLVKFDKGKYESCLNPNEVILLGVHPYDIKAIAMTDKLFDEKHSDCNYLANRKAAVIIGSNVQNHYERAFFGSICQDVPLEGHDAFITQIEGGYFAEAVSNQGKAILALGQFEEATAQQANAAAAMNREANDTCPETLKYSADEIGKKLNAEFHNEALWTELSKDCFSCGSCNMVCPTCYCFDVQDEWGLGAADGKRHRRWDACLTSEFAQVSVQNGTEDFRDTHAKRFRHRIMRKTVYLNDKLGTAACVGCGRCAGACTANIADPVNVITKIMEY